MSDDKPTKPVVVSQADLVATLVKINNAEQRRTNLIYAFTSAIIILLGILGAAYFDARSAQATREEIVRGVACMVEQLAEHRHASVEINRVIADALELSLEQQEQLLPPPIPTNGRALCEEYLDVSTHAIPSTEPVEEPDNE